MHGFRPGRLAGVDDLVDDEIGRKLILEAPVDARYDKEHEATDKECQVENSSSDVVKEEVCMEEFLYGWLLSVHAF